MKARELSFTTARLERRGTKDPAMKVESNMIEIIEQEMAALHKDAFLRSGRSFNCFIKEYAEILARSEKDKTPLVDAGFDFSLLPISLASIFSRPVFALV